MEKGEGGGSSKLENGFRGTWRAAEGGEGEVVWWRMSEVKSGKEWKKGGRWGFYKTENWPNTKALGGCKSTRHQNRHAGQSESATYFRELACVSGKALAQHKDSKCLSTRKPVELKGAGSIKEKPKEGSKATRALDQCICTRNLNQTTKFKPWLSTRLLA